MATLTLTSPVHVGDLVSGITVDKLDLVSLSINFQGATAIVSVMLQHPSSRWTHTLTLTGADGDAHWKAVKRLFPNFEMQLLTLLANEGKLPAGTLA